VTVINGLAGGTYDHYDFTRLDENERTAPR